VFWVKLVYTQKDNMADKYKAVWVSHSSISLFRQCPRAYYLANIYRNPKTGRKITLMSPSMALGQAVHEVIESLSVLPVAERFQKSLFDKFERVWQRLAGKKGGFGSSEQEERYKQRGVVMLQKIIKNPGPLKKLAVKIKQDLPYFWLSEEDNIILCGKIDWLEYMEREKSVHIIDFKTSKYKKEDEDSLQLPIYQLLASHCQSYPVRKVSYWYLEFADRPEEVGLLNIKKAHSAVLKLAKEIKLARSLDRFPCPRGSTGCPACRPLERITRGEGELVGIDDYKREVYVLNEDE
jgi:ATP-dependent helicase/DNAse subunit B